MASEKPKTELYDEIGRNYDQTRQADPYIVERLVHHLRPVREGLYLDVGCGTGNYTIALSRRGVQMVGLDVSSRMIGEASRKAHDIRWEKGSAQAMPFASGSFKGAISIHAHHHFPDLQASFDEIFRVLYPGSRFVLFHGTAEQTRGYWLSEYFPRAVARSVEEYGKRQILPALKTSGFELVSVELYSVRDDLVDKFAYCGKRRPEMYLDPRIRAGISLFAQVATSDEVERGCAQLAADIDSGRINKVMLAWSNDIGDYTFTVAGKPGEHV